MAGEPAAGDIRLPKRLGGRKQRLLESLTDVVAGDLIAIATTGAYTESMASNYNRLPRPAAVLVEAGVARPIVRRESLDDLIRRDVPLGSLGS